MSQIICISPLRFSLTTLFLAAGVAFSPHSFADVKYDIRAKTGDKIRATLYSDGLAVKGNARQGSFGAPSINDKGTVGYACILAGAGLGAVTSNSVVARLAGTKKPKVAVQANTIVDDSFLPSVPGTPFAASGSGRMYLISRDVAVNKKNQVAFAGNLLYTVVNPGNPTTFTGAETAVYGILLPKNKNATSFNNFCIATYLNYFETILTETLSINSQGSVPFSADFFITATRSVPGFAYNSPKGGDLIATTESDVIGLPYFTKFQSFSDPIIAEDNAAFVVADISDTGDDFDGIWQGNNPDLQPVIVKNSTSPVGGIFTNFQGKIGPSRSGKILAFVAAVSGGSVSGGAFRSNVDGSGAKLIAGFGNKAPSNATSGTLGTFTGIELAGSNDVGQVAVLGTTTDAGGTLRSGIWLSDKSGENLTLIVIEGQTLKVGNASKKVTKIAFNAISGLNRNGQVAFTASFSDRTSAVFIARM